MGKKLDCRGRQCFPALIAVDIHSAVRTARARRFRPGLELRGFHRRAGWHRKSSSHPARRLRDDGRRRWSARHLRRTNRRRCSRERCVNAAHFGLLVRRIDIRSGCRRRDLIECAALIAGGVDTATAATRTHLGVHGSGQDCGGKENVGKMFMRISCSCLMGWPDSRMSGNGNSVSLTCLLVASMPCRS